MAMAANCNVSTENECTAIAGCGWSTDGCSECATGTYSGNTDKTCKNCTKPSGAQWVDNYLGQTTNSCPWTLTCNNGTYWNGSTDCQACATNAINNSATVSGNGTNYPATHSCTTCGNNAQANETKTKCECINTHYTMQSDNSCDPKVYKFTLNKNGGTGGTNEFYYKYKTGVSLDKSEYTSSVELTAPTKTKYNYAGYYTEQTDGTQILSASTTYIYANNISNQFDNNIFGGDTTLYAHWTGKPYYIKYILDKDTDTVTTSQTCYYGSECQAIQKPTSYNWNKSGKTFAYWSCYNNTCNQTTINVDTIISEPTTESTANPTYILAGVWQSCKAGYYCSNNKENPCPAGSTTDGGATSIYCCYMKGDTTQICDNNNCYTLPSSENKIYYKSKDNSSCTIAD